MVTPRQMADALRAVLEADRTVYTRNVVNRLQNEEQVIIASEHWQDDKAQACISCHNGHKDSPRDDFAMGDVMGGVVVRIPLRE